MATPEGRVKQKINRALKKHFGDDCYKFMPVKTMFGAKTIDYLLCIRGRFVGIEAKAPGEKPTTLQETTMQTIQDAGGLVFAVDGDEALTYAIDNIKAKQGTPGPA